MFEAFTGANANQTSGNSERAEYLIRGHAQRGGAYNSHLLAGAVFGLLAVAGVMNIWLTLWLVFCLVIGMLMDERSWRRKVSLRAIPGQTLLYLQVLLQAFRDVLPYYLFAYLLYVCLAPVFLKANLVISSFVMLYGFYMVLRGIYLLHYLWMLNFRWEDTGHTFKTHEANLKNRTTAIRHVLWAYFLGNVGLVVRCASQVMTVALFEFFRRRTGMDLTEYAPLENYLVFICIVATVVYLGTFYFTLLPALTIYYRAHRTFHNCPPLYDSIHGIHHRGVLPTQLDSGTISPLEFFITEMSLPAAALVPNWWWTFCQIILAFTGHLPSHDSNTWMKTGRHHLAHHRHFNVNFGLTPGADVRYGTLHSD